MPSPITGIITAHRAAATACGAALVAALAAGAAALAGAVDVTPQPAPDAEARAEGQAPREAPAKEAKTTEQLADEQLPQDALEAREGYGPLEEQIVSELSASVWTCQEPGVALSFDATGFTESRGGEATRTAYAIVAASPAEATSEAGVSKTSTHFTLRTPSGTFMATLATQAYQGGSASVTTLQSDAFSLADAWTAAERSRSVVVEGPQEAWYDQNGTSAQALVDAFDEFVGTSWPTVTSAEWDGTVAYDYARGAAILPFRLDDSSHTRVQAVLDLQTGSFTVEAA